MPYEMSLERQVKHAVETLRKMPKRRCDRSMERDLVIFWGVYRGWSYRFIADQMRQSVRTVTRRLRFFYKNPSAIFTCTVLTRHAKHFRCEFCGSQLSIKDEKAARQHVALHVVTKEAVYVNGVMKEWY